MTLPVRTNSWVPRYVIFPSYLLKTWRTSSLTLSWRSGWRASSCMAKAIVEEDVSKPAVKKMKHWAMISSSVKMPFWDWFFEKLPSSVSSPLFRSWSSRCMKSFLGRTKECTVLPQLLAIGFSPVNDVFLPISHGVQHQLPEEGLLARKRFESGVSQKFPGNRVLHPLFQRHGDADSFGLLSAKHQNFGLTRSRFLAGTTWVGSLDLGGSCTQFQKHKRRWRRWSNRRSRRSRWFPPSGCNDPEWDPVAGSFPAWFQTSSACGWMWRWDSISGANCATARQVTGRGFAREYRSRDGRILEFTGFTELRVKKTLLKSCPYPCPENRQNPWPAWPWSTGHLQEWTWE